MPGLAVHTPTAEEDAAWTTRYTEAQAREETVEEFLQYQQTGQGWSPQYGSQVYFLQCPLFEALLHGTRGSGKSEVLLMSFAQHVGQGHGNAWRGVIFRQTYPQLADIVAKSERWFRLIFPEAEFNRASHTWTWPSGEALLFRHMARPADYWLYHGAELPFIGWEEVTNWADDQCYLPMFACCRTSRLGVPRMIRANTNPFGRGHAWVRERFGLYGRWWEPQIIQEGAKLRVALHSSLRENRILLEADPTYEDTISASATNPAMKDAWLRGDWDVTSGGMFDDLWKPEHNVVMPFEVPETWRVDRSFDWGSSAPFAVCWWAESDGSDVMIGGRQRPTVRGDLFLTHEWYGWTGHANTGCKMLAVDVAKGIVERELAWKLRPRVKAGPADSSIFDTENGVCIARDMAKPVRIGNQMEPGVSWLAADKRAGSRVQGAERLRTLIKAAQPNTDGTPREAPGLFVVGERCPQFLRTVPTLPRDERDPDDVDTNAEDHVYDAVRYRIWSGGRRVRQGHTTGAH